MKNTISISSDSPPVASIPAMTSSHPLIVNVLDATPADQRMQILERALIMGCLALKEDRMASFLARTQSELGAQLESLQLLYQTTQNRQASPVIKGKEAEQHIAQALGEFITRRRWNDELQLVGDFAGQLPRNKTGDIVCSVADSDRLLVIECKLDKSVRLGDISTEALSSGKSDNAIGQLVEARSNRGAEMAIIVFSMENADRSITNFTDSVRYVDGLGYVVVIDVAKADFRPLAIAYELARSHLHQPKSSLQSEQLDILVRRFTSELQSAMQVKEMLGDIQSRAEQASALIDQTLAGVQKTHQMLSQLIHKGELNNLQLLELILPHKVPALKG